MTIDIAIMGKNRSEFTHHGEGTISHRVWLVIQTTNKAKTIQSSIKTPYVAPYPL